MIDIIVSVAGLLGVSAQTLRDSIRTAKDNHRQKRLRAQLRRRDEKYPEILEKRLLAKLLNQYYDTSKLQGVNPVLVQTAVGPIETQLVTPVEWEVNGMSTPLKTDGFSLIDEGDPELLFNHQSHDLEGLTSKAAGEIIAGIELRGGMIWDAPLYRLWNLNIKNGSIHADFKLTRFLIYRLTVGALWDEAIDALIAADMNIDRICSNPQKYMPLRAKFLPDNQAFIDPQRALCVGGPSVVLAIAREDDYVIPFIVRSNSVSAGNHLISLVPQGFHQPKPKVDPKLEVEISSTVFRELYEELFGGFQVMRDDASVSPDWFYDACEAMKWFREKPDSYQLEVLSLARNLVNNNFEFGMLLVINDKNYWDKYQMMKTNDEAQTIRFLSTRDSAEIDKKLTDPRWTETLPFFEQGLNRLREIDPNRFAQG